MASISNEEWQQLYATFAAESIEMIEEVEPKLIELEKRGLSQGVDQDLLAGIFRLFHSFKGGAACLNLNTMRDLTHHAEALFEAFRSGKQNISPGHIDLVCQTNDLLRKMLDAISNEGVTDPFRDEAQTLIARFQKAVAGEDAPPPAKAAPTPAPAAPAAPVVPAVPATAPATAGWDAAEQQLKGAPAAGAAKAAPPTATAPVAKQIPLAGDPPPAAGAIAGSLDELRLSLTPEMIQGFADESTQLFEEIEQSLMLLEKNAHDAEALHQAFRGFHSFKGNCGFFGFVPLERLSHRLEEVLEQLQNAKMPVNSEVITVMLRGLDVLRSGTAQIRAGQPINVAEQQAGIEPALARLEKGEALEPPPVEAPKLGQILVDMGEVAPEAVEKALEVQQNLAPTPDKGELHTPAEGAAQAAPTHQAAAQQRSIRVDVDKLDKMMDLVGELVISVATVINNPDLAGLRLDRFEKSSHQLSKITRDLQDVAMAMRMVPLTSLFRKMVRLVRDLANKFNKEVDLVLVGEDTEVDKTVLELVSDPLVHMIRNAIDHGIETPAERTAHGKAPGGKIVLEARHAGSEVWLLVIDDGRGLDRGRIVNKAITLGMLNEDSPDLRDEDVFKFIFESGFSTAEKVTDVSGRGVGMDVVRRNIEQLKGRIDIKSTKGTGSTFILRIPLTLAIIDGMLIRCGTERYIVPTETIVEAFRTSAKNITESVGNLAETLFVRGHVIPFLRLGKLFGLATAEQDIEKAIVIMVEDSGRHYGILVDEILGQQQTVIKSLAGTIGNLEGFSGASVLPDGRVGLILDVHAVVNMAGR